MSKSITISVEPELYEKLTSRAKKQMQTLSELAEDILRRSMLSYKKTQATPKGDDSLISIFSRARKGRKVKKWKKIKIIYLKNN